MAGCKKPWLSSIASTEASISSSSSVSQEEEKYKNSTYFYSPLSLEDLKASIAQPLVSRNSIPSRKTLPHCIHLGITCMYSYHSQKNPPPFAPVPFFFPAQGYHSTSILRYSLSSFYCPMVGSTASLACLQHREPHSSPPHLANKVHILLALVAFIYRALHASSYPLDLRARTIKLLHFSLTLFQRVRHSYFAIFTGQTMFIGNFTTTPIALSLLTVTHIFQSCLQSTISNNQTTHTFPPSFLNCIASSPIT